MRDIEKARDRILVLDDDEVVLLAIKESLIADNYDVAVFSSVKAALTAIEEEHFSVIISDQRMPEMSGLDFLCACKNLQPHASRILITGVLTLNTVIDAVNKGEIFRFLAKPWIREELIATVNTGAQRHHVLQQDEALRHDTVQLNEQLAATNRELHGRIKELTQHAAGAAP